MASERSERGKQVLTWACAAFFGAALAFAVWAHWQVPVLPIDDGYIHLRYVRNILTGVGPVYNAGQRVMGSSSPLYVAWLTALGWVTGAGDLEALAVRSNALWYVCCMVAMAGMLRQMSDSWPLALLLGSAAALFTPMLAVSTGAMEPYLWGALVLGCLWAQGARHRRTAATLAGLAAVARPEGLLLLGLWGLRWLAERPARERGHDTRQRRDGREMALALGPLAIWIAVSTSYYGTPLPQSVLAKASGLYPLDSNYVPDRLAELFPAWIGGGALAWNPPASEPASGGFISFAQGLMPWLAMAGVLATRRARQRGAWGAAAMLAMLCLFYILGRTMLLEWYLPLIWVLWYPAVFGGAATLLSSAWEKGRTRHSRWHGALAVGTAILLGTVFVTGPARGALELLRRENVATIVSEDPVRMRVLAYQQAGRWLNRVAPAGARLAGTEVGTLGYYYPGYIIDACALVSPEALRYLPVPMTERYAATDGVIANALVRDLQPEYVASMPTFAGASIMRDPWFLAHYKQAAAFRLPQPLWGSENVLVWERTEPPLGH